MATVCIHWLYPVAKGSRVELNKTAKFHVSRTDCLEQSVIYQYLITEHVQLETEHASYLSGLMT